MFLAEVEEDLVHQEGDPVDGEGPGPGDDTALHYGLTGGWVQKFKVSYLAYFLQCALTDYASRKA